MGSIPTYSGYGAPRPAPTQAPPGNTWQSRRENEARDMWDEQGVTTRNDQQRAGAARDTYRGGADRALDDFNRGTPSNTAAFQPLNIQGYSPNQVMQWQTAAMGAGGFSGGGGGRTSAAGAAGGSAALSAYKSKELENFDSSDVSDFDPTSYGKEFAAGAGAEFDTDVSEQLHTLENQGAGTGRLKTGFYTRDQGDVLTRVRGDLNSKLAQASTTFSGQKLGALESGAGMRLARAQGIDSNMLTRAQGMDANALEGGRAADAFSLSEEGNDLERSRMGLSAAQFEDEQGYQRASDLDRYGSDRARYMDDQNFQRGQTGLDAALAREGRYMDDYHRYADRGADYASANRDWAASDRETQDARDVAANARRRPQTIGGDPWEDNSQQGIMRRQASALGVPYRG